MCIRDSTSLEGDHLQQAIVGPRHRCDAHAAAERRAIADRYGMAVEQAFAFASIWQRDAAAQSHAAAHDDAAQGGLGVGDAAAQDGGGGGDVAIHEPADAGGKHVDPVAIRQSSATAGEARQPDIDSALVTACYGGEVVLHAVRDTERAAEVAAGAGGDETERGKSGCLLYTSDAADDLLCVDLGGRR